MGYEPTTHKDIGGLHLSVIVSLVVAYRKLLLPDVIISSAVAFRPDIPSPFLHGICFPFQWKALRSGDDAEFCNRHGCTTIIEGAGTLPKRVPGSIAALYFSVLLRWTFNVLENVCWTTWYKPVQCSPTWYGMLPSISNNWIYVKNDAM